MYYRLVFFIIKHGRGGSMSDKLNFTSKTLLDLTFSKNVKGYDPLQVDIALDKVIVDYRFFENFYHESKPLIKELEKKIANLSKSNREKDAEIAKLSNRLASIKENPNVARENIDLIRRIDALERALYAHGVDPSKIK